jgi:hypothetical protein
VRVEVIHSAARDGSAPLPGSHSAPVQMPHASAKAISGEPVVFSRLDDLPLEASVDRAIYEQLGVKSCVAMPFFVAPGFRGALECASVRHERVWPDELLVSLRSLANVFGKVLARKHAQEDLNYALGFERLAFLTCD